MIIQSARLRTNTNLPQLKAHVFAGAANDDIVLLHGDPDDLDAMQDDAAAAAKPFAIRHFKISPAKLTSRTEIAGVMRELGAEFGFALDRCVVVEHAKPRQPGGYERHWHLLVPEWDPVRRRVLDSKWMRPRQEKIARRTEARLGHALVAGRWNAAVSRRLEAEGETSLAVIMAGLARQPRPVAAYSARQLQAAARKGVDLAQCLTLIRAAWAAAEDCAAFVAEIGGHGMRVRLGDIPGVWLVEAATKTRRTPTVRLGALQRLLQAPRAAVDSVMVGQGMRQDLTP